MGKGIRQGGVILHPRIEAVGTPEPGTLQRLSRPRETEQGRVDKWEYCWINAAVPTEAVGRLIAAWCFGRPQMRALANIEDKTVSVGQDAAYVDSPA